MKLKNLALSAIFAVMFALSAFMPQAYANEATRASFIAAVKTWDGDDREIGLWLAFNHKHLTRVYDRKGEYAPQFRVNKNMGAMGICAHYDHKKRKWFLESQTFAAERIKQKHSYSKFIRWNDEGKWIGRTHVVLKIGTLVLLDHEKNHAPRVFDARRGLNIAKRNLAAMRRVSRLGARYKGS